MAKVSIPVDLFNPGEVFACMGFLEAADILLGNAMGGFQWFDDAEPRFEICANGVQNPFGTVLDFVTKAQLQRLAPDGYADAPASGETKKQKKNAKKQPKRDGAGGESSDSPVRTVDTFPGREADRLALPLRLEQGAYQFDVTHWSDGSSRNSFKLFAGQQRSNVIAQQMLDAIRELWRVHNDKLADDPLGPTVPLGGSSFKFDARKSWTAIDAGYSPDEQTHGIEASPVVELLAAVGLEHARPDEFETRKVTYGVWRGLLPPALARPALAGIRFGVQMRVFRFTLDLAGKNKVVTFAQEEINT